MNAPVPQYSLLTYPPVVDPLPLDYNPLPQGGISMPLPAIGAGLVSGLGTTIATVYGRREERQRIKKQNALYEQAASRMAARGRADMMRQNQGASGQLAYMQYRSRNNPQVLDALRSMYSARVQTGAQLNSQSLAAANDMLARRQAMPTNGDYDAWAGIGSGLAQMSQTFGSLYKPAGA